MGQEEVSRKLRAFLENENPFQHEKDVVYFLVETRKALDHLRKNGESLYSILRFYCDWAVHTDKERLNSEMQEIIEAIDQSRYKQRNEALDRFVRMEHLQADMRDFIARHNLTEKDITSSPIWEKFYGLLVKVLSDQPLLLRGNLISFRFIANEDTLRIEYDYT